jgi:AAA family ATP:ADP antiporter
VRWARQAVELGTAGELDMGGFIGKFYSDFFAVVNAAGLFIQLFLVSRIIKYLGVRVAIMILPCIALGGYMILAFYPILTAVRWAKTAENATDYSLQNTVRNVLFLPTTREQKYKAKQAIDTFFVRTGDVLSAALVFVGTTWLAFQTQHFAIFNLALVVVWLFLAFLIGKEYVRLVAAKEAAGETRPAA